MIPIASGFSDFQFGPIFLLRGTLTWSLHCTTNPAQYDPDSTIRNVDLNLNPDPDPSLCLVVDLVQVM